MIVQSVKMALKSILSNKLRSFLTMLGIIIGVVSLVVLVSLVHGAAGSITDSVNALGSNLLNVSISDDHDRPVKLSELSEFTDDAAFSSIAPSVSYTASASGAFTEESARITGTTAAYMDIQGLELEEGRFLMKPDVDNHSNIAVISADLAADIIGRKNAVGENIKLNGKNFQIIGILKEKESASNSVEGSTYQAYIPYTSLIRLTENVTLNVSSFCIRAAGDDMDAAERKLEAMLLRRFEQDEDAFSIFNQSSVAKAMESVTSTLALLLGGIAGISLLVGGIGIMNIMLVSVTERTKEIGIRKAIGARRGAIMLQFLIEALIISLLGCIFGIVFSWAIIYTINAIGSSHITLSPGIVLLSIVFSAGIGVLFGLYPANKAAKKTPIEALAYH